jgi:hypothetical protein
MVRGASGKGLTTGKFSKVMPWRAVEMGACSAALSDTGGGAADTNIGGLEGGNAQWRGSGVMLKMT